MKRLVALGLAALLFAHAALAGIPEQIAVAKTAYQQMVKKNPEAARETYANRLSEIAVGIFKATLERGDRPQRETIDPVYQELCLLPAPAKNDAAKFRPGKWQTPRHDLDFKPNGTWVMAPVEKGATHGTWKIEGNQYYENASDDTSRPPTTIILANKDYFVFMDGRYVYVEWRRK